MYSIKINSEILKTIDTKNLISKKKFLSNYQGIHRSNKKGYGLEFADYRQYELGDDPRHIDWGVYSRSEKVVVKTFQEELSINFQIIVDSSNSMRLFNKLEKALEIAGIIAYLAINQNDSTQIILPGRGSTPKIKSLKSFYQNINLEKFQWNKQNFNFVEETKKIINLSQFPCVVIIISDFLFELEELNSFLKYCNSRRFESFCLQTLSKNEINPIYNSQLQDLETGKTQIFSSAMKNEYQNVFLEHQKNLENCLKRNNCSFSNFQSEEVLSNSLIDKFLKLGIIQ